MKGFITNTQNTQILENIVQIILPTVNGDIEILQDHAELFCMLLQGSIQLKKSTGERLKFPIEQGVAYFKNNNLTIIE